MIRSPNLTNRFTVGLSVLRGPCTRMARMFRRILVANRGEIAARILKACGRMGIRTVAVHSTADAGSPHLKLADETVCIGGPRPADSYLNADAILQAAEQTHSQAIHPGYGFLSENASLARECEAAGITFIGPNPETLELFGNKVEARALASSLSIPVVPGTAIESAADVEALRLALGIESWNLLGISYGTRLAQIVARDYPSGIRSIVLDSTLPVSADPMAESLANAARAFNVFFTGCQADDECSRAYPTLEADLNDLLTSLNLEPIIVSITYPLTGEQYDALVNGDALARRELL